MTDLSVLIAARNEMFLPDTVRDVLANARGAVEVIVILDGEKLADDPLADDPRLTVVSLPAPIGQRAAVNLAARHATARHIMKLDAHCALDEGFDVKLCAALDEHPDWTVIPAQRNLHVFDWRCLKCGERTYMGPSLDGCAKCGHPVHERVMVWQPRAGTRTDFWRFDADLHFQYRGEWHGRRWEDGDYGETLSCLGACWALSVDRYWQLGGLDEAHGSWGQMGTEMACKAFLSGGKLITHRGTWFAHMFRTRADFSFPYAMHHSDQEKARAYSRELWLNDAWPGQVYPLAWLINRFKPLPGWHEPEGRERLAHIRASERRFYLTHENLSRRQQKVTA